MQPETRVRLDIRGNLQLLGFLVWDLEQNRRTRQTPGFSDLVATGFGWVLFLEVKTPKMKGRSAGKQSPAQIVFENAINSHDIVGCRYFVVKSWADTQKLLEDLDILSYTPMGVAVMVDRV